MKKVEIITRPDKLDGLKELLTAHNCQGMTVLTVMGCGKQRGYVAEMNLPELTVNLLPKIFVMTVIADSELDNVLTDIYEVLGTGSVGDGKVCVYDVVEVMRMRTGERGEKAL